MRRHAFILALFLMFLTQILTPAPLSAENTQNAHAFSFETQSGAELPLSDYRGKLVLVVNTATECGFAGQIGGLQELWDRFGDKGLIVLGVPSNDFGGQEPRSNDEIIGYCETRYGAHFPMTAKTSVKGKDAHDFYRWARQELGLAARPYWNFHKYLIGPEGNILAWFSTPTGPNSKRVVSAIEKHLAVLPGFRALDQ